jgi:ABC-type uncharacterized transport system permease subunit
MAVGAYVSAILTAKLGWSFWIALPCAGLAAGIAGLIFGLPSLKIKGFYLIMATVAAHFIIIWLILQFQNITGGADGLAVPKPKIGSFVFKSKVSYFYLVMAIACLATILAKNIVRTRAGRGFVAIRDNDLAAEVMGISLWSYKLQAFFIGCIYAGVAGADEVEGLVWLVEVVQKTVDVPLVLDSANPEVIAAALKVHKGRPMINSISGEPMNASLAASDGAIFLRTDRHLWCIASETKR